MAFAGVEGIVHAALRENRNCALDFHQYRFRVITCEHNFTPMREKIHDLLAGHGYRRVFSHISHCDDWYLDART